MIMGKFEGLENLVIEKYKDINYGLKGYLVDTSSRILFYVPAIGLWEKFVAGMDDNEVLKSRCLAFLTNSIGVGKLHTLCRQYLAKLTHTDENSSKLRKQLIDFSAGFVIGIPYSASLYLIEASFSEGIKAAPFVVGFVCLTGNFYGKFNDWYRQKFNIPPILNK